MKWVSALAGFISLLLAAPVTAERLVRQISWSALKAEGRLVSGEVVPASGRSTLESLRVTNPDGAPRTVSLVEIDSPGLTNARYMLCGEVRGEGIEGPAYLEMLSFFAGGGRSSSRALTQPGGMASLSGTFGFRPFILRFTAEPGMKPEKLAVHVAFPGRGTVSLAKLSLEELDLDEYFLPAGPWLTPRQISLVGGIGGSLLGLLGALVGILVSRGQARALVFALLKGTFAFGVAVLLAFLNAGWLWQPPALLYTLFVLGILGTVLPAGFRGKVRRRYDELRRRRALDAC